MSTRAGAAEGRRRRVGRKTAVGLGVLAVAIAVAFGWGPRLEAELETVVDELPGRGAMLEERAREAGERSGAPAFPVRGEMTESDAAVLFPTVRRGVDVFDPLVFFRRPAHLSVEVVSPDPGAPEPSPEGWTVVTNSLGLRQGWELSEERPDLRVLVVGDSQTAGVCPYADSIPGRLQRRLSDDHPDRTVEVVNGGKGAWTFHNYLGLLDRLRDVPIDVVVVVSYAGNDYSEALLLHHYLASTAPPRNDADFHARLRNAVRLSSPSVAHTLQQAHYFAGVPDQTELALGAARAVTAEILRVCAERGIEPVFASVPTSIDAQPELFAPGPQNVVEALGLSASERDVNVRLADAWLAFLEERGVETLDLRELLSSGEEPYYSRRHHHLNGAGNRRIAEALLPRLARRLSEDPR